MGTAIMEAVLVGIDRSEPSRRALRFALAHARNDGWRVRIVHVVNLSQWYEVPTLPDLQQRPLRIEAERKSAAETLFGPLLEEMDAEGLLEGLEYETAIRFGRPSEVLSDIAGSEDFSLIIVARTGDSNLKQAIFGSTASRLVQHAPIPVVVVP